MSSMNNMELRTLYLDLDGVMAGFDEAFPRVFGCDHREIGEPAMWEKITARPGFFLELDVLPGAIEFFREFEFMRPVILTACPKGDYYADAARAKRAWVRRHLSETAWVLPVLGGVNKPLFMHNPGDILVDDWSKNTRAWEAAGGVAILHRQDFAETSRALWSALTGTMVTT